MAEIELSAGSPQVGWQPPYHFRDDELGRLDVDVPNTDESVEVRGFRLPQAFTIDAKERALPLVDVSVESGRPECVAIRRRPDGPPLTGEALRDVPVKRLIDAAVYGLAVERSGRRLGDVDVWQHVLGRGGRADVEEAFGRRRPLTDERLEEVATVYRQAVELGRPPREEVKQAFRVSHSTAGRYVMEARRRGKLGPAIPRRAGEAR